MNLKFTHYSFQILKKLELCEHIFRKILISNFIKIRPVGDELFNADLTKLIANFCVSANSSKRNMYYCSTE